MEPVKAEKWEGWNVRSQGTVVFGLKVKPGRCGTLTEILWVLVSQTDLNFVCKRSAWDVQKDA